MSKTLPRGAGRPASPGAAGLWDALAGPRARNTAASNAAPNARGRAAAVWCCRWGLDGGETGMEDHRLTARGRLLGRSAHTRPVELAGDIEGNSASARVC